jgi:hypothetical protein
MHEDSSSSGGIGFSHNVLDVLFHGLFSNLKGVCNLFIGPSLCQVFNDGLFAIRQLKLFSGLIGIQLLSPC